MTGDCRGRRLTPQDHLVVGVAVDDETRCAHYRSDRDIVAIRFPCCETYYPCFRCHEPCADHDAKRWPRGRFDEPAVCCGVCGIELSVRAYLDCDHQCPNCEAMFNPGCRNHADRYFAVD
ncbi:CHY zinc finger protein [Halohasta litorea]|uniref:CHY zinc finger protein n=1 Tax=Halohasta litorea TaxID=869891 RepID=A0ABD6D6K2_9EURY|nr:CHY zinc finger protein [Halohasta litorea]